MSTFCRSNESFLKIFRPWDSKDEQDATVTTTSREDFPPLEILSRKFSAQESKHNHPDKDEDKETQSTKQFKSKSHTVTYENSGTVDVSNQVEYNSLSRIDPYPIYPDLVHANLAQSLGLNPADPLFMESIAQGYAMEEYARIITQEQQAKLLSNRKQRPKKYKCPHCDVGFSNNGQLKGHIRIHTGERPFRCDEENCGKTFTRNEELTRHKRIHSGLRPFPCNQCGKRFGRKDHLKKHTRTHIQPRGVYAVPIMLHPLDSWTPSPTGYPYIPLYGY